MGLLSNAQVYRNLKVGGKFDKLLATVAELPNGQWRLYFNDEIHHEYETPDGETVTYTNRELAELLSKGNAHMAPRPAISQFLWKKRAEIEQMIAARVRDGVMNVARSSSTGRFMAKGVSTEEHVARGLIEMFQEFVDDNGVTPENAPYTVYKKGFDKPWVEHGDLMTNGLACAFEPSQGEKITMPGGRGAKGGAKLVVTSNFRMPKKSNRYIGQGPSITGRNR